MIENWNIRLKQCREKKGYSLNDLEGITKLDLSQQSLIKYEKGEVFPRINVLDKMCKLYGTSIDYILYGDQNINTAVDHSSTLLVLFMLFHSKKIGFDSRTNSIYINDSKFRTQVKMIHTFYENTDITTLDDLNRLVEGIKKIELDFKN